MPIFSAQFERYRYDPLSQHSQKDNAQRRRRWSGHLICLMITAFTGLVFVIACIWTYLPLTSTGKSCDSINGYHCRPTVSYFWGQYSPYFSVPSDIDSDTPPDCTITFAQILSRHGGRDPTKNKSDAYHATVSKLQARVQTFPGKYSFLKDYRYTLGADQLTAFGRQQMVYSGMKFYKRYASLAQKITPFIRASGQTRVVESAEQFALGFHNVKSSDKQASDDNNYPYNVLIFPEHESLNNSLSHELCFAFENQPTPSTQQESQAKWMDVFVPSIRQRLNNDLPTAGLSQLEVVNLMDLCPFETIANPTGSLSAFCTLFTDSEWHQYDYFHSLGKYYGYGNGNRLGPTQGVGFTNELISRLTNTPVDDHTSTNYTLDSDQLTFPLGGKHALFADFSHDNDLMTIYSAMGLYNATEPLSNVSMQTVTQTRGYAASWAVPFAARAYIEKMTCSEHDEELVRVLINDRVLPLQSCGADSLGRCRLTAFVESLSFARNGGYWDQCF